VAYTDGWQICVLRGLLRNSALLKHQWLKFDVQRILDSTHIQTFKIFEAKGKFFTILKKVSHHHHKRQWIISPEGISLNHRRQRVTSITPPPYSIGLEFPVQYEQESTSEGTLYHNNIESYTTPFKTDAESHLSAPPSTTPHPWSSLPQHTHLYYLTLTGTATAHSPLLPRIEASTDAAFVLLLPHHTTRSSQPATHRELHPRTLLLTSSP
jgi:hypothetical protein